MKMRKKKQEAGSQSVPCPGVTRGKPCGLGSRVVRTVLVPTGTRRTRRCPRGHVFVTEEKPT